MKIFLIIVSVIVLFFPLVLTVGFVFGICGPQKKAYLNQTVYQASCLMNTVCAVLFNKTLAKKEGYSFGKKDEATSSAIGKNLRDKTITNTGKVVNFIINLFDRNHAIKNIQP